jgi:hypothetical protein
MAQRLGVMLVEVAVTQQSSVVDTGSGERQCVAASSHWRGRGEDSDDFGQHEAGGWKWGAIGLVGSRPGYIRGRADMILVSELLFPSLPPVHQHKKKATDVLITRGSGTQTSLGPRATVSFCWRHVVERAGDREQASPIPGVKNQRSVFMKMDTDFFSLSKPIGYNKKSNFEKKLNNKLEKQSENCKN